MPTAASSAPAARSSPPALQTDPTLAEALERQRTALAMIAAAAEPAPLDLRLRIEELRAAPPPVRFWARRRRPAIAAAFALAAMLMAFAVLLAGRGPVVDDVLAVALRPATAPAATGEAFEGIRFPYYDKWHATGARTDVIDGRRVRTVFYERDGPHDRVRDRRRARARRRRRAARGAR